jgi:hypothetical protein
LHEDLNLVKVERKEIGTLLPLKDAHRHMRLYTHLFSPFHSPFREGSGSRKLPPDDCRRAEGTWNPKWIQMKRMNAWRRQETQRRKGMKKRTANYVAGLKVEASMIVNNDTD